MGYVLPVNDYQSRQYASRLLNEGNYAKVSKLHRVQPVKEYSSHYEEAIADENFGKNKQDEHPVAASNPKAEVLVYVHPNPANISKSTVRVMDKQSAINAYL